MTDIISALALALSLILTPQPSGIAGRWQGTLDLDQDVRVVLQFEERGPGQVGCTANFIELEPDTVRCESASVVDGVVRFVLSDPSVVFEGRLSADRRTLDGTLTGTVTRTATGPRPLKLVSTSDAAAWPTDPAPHKVQMVASDDGVRLEVLDFGGSGPPLILVAGLGATGHDFDAFAPRLTGKNRVYAVTRRGFGRSDRPDPTPAAYSSRRLGDDIVAAMAALKIERAILAGHSAGGAELSSVATHHPERVAGLVYLDAAGAYSYYAPGNMFPPNANIQISATDLVNKVRAAAEAGPQNSPGLIDEILRTSIPDLQADLTAFQTRQRQFPPQPQRAAPPPAPAAPARPLPVERRVVEAMMQNMEKYPALQVPVLAIFAIPAPPAQPNPAVREQQQINIDLKKETIARFRAAHPKARVVELQNAEHAVFASNPEDVLREMAAFIETLPGR